MTKLTRGALRKAEDFLRTDARPLERALYGWHFRSDPADAVLTELAAYQNRDGGFGNALEPDYRAPESSALATSLALEILEEMDAPADDPLVTGAANWLSENFVPERRIWRFIPEKAAPAPSAPWWGTDNLDETFGGFLINPRAKIIAHLRHFPGAFPESLLDELDREVADIAENLPVEVAVDTLLAARDLHSAEGLSEEVRDRLFDAMTRWIPRSVEFDPAKWGEYCLKPLAVADRPDSPWYGMMEEAVRKNLDYEIEIGNTRASWEPFWDWRGAFPETWDIARREWSGILTLRNLRILRAYGRIAEER